MPRSPLQPHVPRLPVQYVHTDEQWDAVCSDIRWEILQHVQSCGPSSIPELACEMAAASDGLYHHVRKLHAAGLLRDLGARHTGRRFERVYDAAADRLRFDIDTASGRNSSRLLRILKQQSGRTSKRFRAALAAHAARVEEPFATAIIDSEAARLDEDDLAELRKHIGAIRRLFSACRARRCGTLSVLTLTLCPVVRPRSHTSRRTSAHADAAQSPAAKARTKASAS